MTSFITFKLGSKTPIFLLRRYPYYFLTKVQTTPFKFEDLWILHIRFSKFKFYSLNLYSVSISSLSVHFFFIKCHINLPHMFNSSNKMKLCGIMKMTLHNENGMALYYLSQSSKFCTNN